MLAWQARSQGDGSGTWRELVLPLPGRKASKGPPYALYKSAASWPETWFTHLGGTGILCFLTSDLVLVGVLVVLTIATVG